jgi:hypothetical protein
LCFLVFRIPDDGKSLDMAVKQGLLEEQVKVDWKKQRCASCSLCSKLYSAGQRKKWQNRSTMNEEVWGSKTNKYAKGRNID